MSAGLHIVTKKKPGKPIRHYVYAWRGGPLILKKEGGAKPAVTQELTDKAAELRRERPQDSNDTIAGLIDRYTNPNCAEWKKLSASTRTDYTTWHRRITEEFGRVTLKLFHDRRVRADVLDWRDRFSATPRAADMGITTFSALITWAVDRGLMQHNILLGINRLYESDRSDIIWEQHHFEAFAKHASVEVQEAVDLAAATGLRRGDLVKLPWSAIGEKAIVWRTGKSKGKNMVVVPLTDEATTVFDRIKARHAAEMEAKRPDRRKPLPPTVLANSYWEPWTPKGFGSRFNDAKQASGIDVNLHDLRGTFATLLMQSGDITDQQIAEILGWSTKDVDKIRMKYVSHTRVVIGIADKLAAAKMRA
jgi:Site-specific recombinase XerD